MTRKQRLSKKSYAPNFVSAVACTVTLEPNDISRFLLCQRLILRFRYETRSRSSWRQLVLTPPPPPTASTRPPSFPHVPPFCARAQMLAVQSVSRAQFAPTTSAEEALGRELLTLLGRSPSAANAFHLCVQLGLMKHHENLFALEAGIEKVGEVCLPGWWW